MAKTLCNSFGTCKKALLTYDISGLMWKEWIIALLWLKLLHFLIMHKNPWPITWML